MRNLISTLGIASGRWKSKIEILFSEFKLCTQLFVGCIRRKDVRRRQLGQLDIMEIYLTQIDWRTSLKPLVEHSVDGYDVFVLLWCPGTLHLIIRCRHIEMHTFSTDVMKLQVPIVAYLYERVREIDWLWVIGFSFLRILFITGAGRAYHGNLDSISDSLSKKGNRKWNASKRFVCLTTDILIY